MDDHLTEEFIKNIAQNNIYYSHSNIDHCYRNTTIAVRTITRLGSTFEANIKQAIGYFGCNQQQLPLYQLQLCMKLINCA